MLLIIVMLLGEVVLYKINLWFCFKKEVLIVYYHLIFLVKVTVGKLKSLTFKWKGWKINIWLNQLMNRHLRVGFVSYFEVYDCLVLK